MAGTNTLPPSPLDDLDDMVYVSDGDKSDLKDNVMQPHVQPGMIPDIKAFYPGERDDRTGRVIVTDKRPDDLPEPEETDENGRYALVIRYVRCYDGRKQLSISSVVVQSPLLKRVLSWVLKDYPCMAPDLDRLEVVSPFRPFVHRWQRLVYALQCEQDPETKSHIRLFYDALKTELDLTLETRNDFFDHSTITFNALWMIFSPGDIIFTTHNKRQVAAKVIDSMIDSGRYEDVYRLECEMIHCDGTSFGWGKHWFDIPEFAGMRKINDLPVYPIDFHRNVDRITQKLISKGKAYERLLRVHHKQYRGIALDGHHPFYVDSRIMIDGETYACHNPDRQIFLKPMKKVKIPASYNAEPSEQSDSSDDDETDTEATYKSKKPGSVPALTDEQLMLCGNSVRGYSLRNKRWLDFFVDNINDIDWKKNAWDDVVLDAEQKALIFSMTEGHRLNHKGPQTKGLNIVICGPTGIGKTFAVESVAESLRAPLLHLTSADIDLDPSDPDLESPFTDLLEMCGKWNAILLHDEVQGSLVGNKLDKYGNECLLLMQALETHSTAFFVTCDSAAEDCMNERFLSRFHVALNLPELTTATRETIWQKCLESHEDISFFVDRKTLAGWPLNGREINNAVTAAKTLAINGTLDMKQLERVIPASKRPIMRVPIVKDPWDSPPVSKDKKQKKVKKPVVDEAVEIVEEPTKRDDDDWGNWGTWGIKKKTKKDPVESEFPDGFGIRQGQVIDKDNDTLAIRKCRTSDWVGFDDYKRLSSSPPFSPPLNWGKTSTWASGALENDADWEGFSKPKKSWKEKDAAAKKPRIPEAADAPPVPEIADSWGDWRSKKDKNAQQAASPSREVTMPAVGVAKKDVLPLPDTDDGWGSFGRKKETKAKKISNTEPEAPPSVEAATSSHPLLPPVEVDEWDFWASSKNSKKGKKKAVIDEPLSLPPAAESIQGQDNGIKRSLHPEQICDIRGIKQNILDGAHGQTCGTSSIERGGATTLTPGNKIVSKAVALPNQCRFCGGRSDAKKGQYCKHCGAHVL